jgi:cytochrome b
MASLSTKAVAAVALVAVLSVLGATGVRAQQENYTASLATSYSSGWLPAKATWYGAPTGAGPNDNGKDQVSPLWCPGAFLIWAMWLTACHVLSRH